MGWLEKYAEKEKEKEQSSADLTHNFFSKTAAPQTSDSEYREETGNTKQSNKAIDDEDMSINDNEEEAIAATIEQTEEITLVRQVSLGIESAREEASNLSEGHPNDEEQCDTPLLLPKPARIAHK